MTPLCLFTRVALVVVAMGTFSSTAHARAHLLLTDDEGSPDTLLSESDETDAEAKSKVAVDDDTGERWMFRGMAALAAPVGSIVSVGAFLLLRLAVVGLVSYGPPLLLGRATTEAELSLYSLSLLTYVLVPIIAGLGAALFVLPFTSWIGSLVTGVLTTGATIVLTYGGFWAGLLIGLFIGGAVGLYVGVQENDPLVGLIVLMVGAYLGGGLGALMGGSIGVLAGMVATPGITGALVGRKPSFWDETMASAGEE